MMSRLVHGLRAFIATFGVVTAIVTVLSIFDQPNLTGLLDLVPHWSLIWLLPCGMVAAIAMFWPPPRTAALPPEAIPPTDGEESRRNRAEFNYRLRAYMERSSLQYLDCSDTMPIDPAVALPEASAFIDCIASVVVRDGRTLVLFPSADSTPDVEGVGRTAILLDLLGLAIPYGRLIGLDPEELAATGSIPIDDRFTSSYRLVASDIAYLGAPSKRLTAVPIHGEIASFAWDLARHLYRSTELRCTTGAHRSPDGREKLLTLFHRVRIDRELEKRWARLDAVYGVDEVIILKRRIDVDPRSPVRREITGNDRLEALRRSLSVSLEHGSNFWKRNRSAIEARIDSIVASLDDGGLPRISEIAYSHPSPSIPLTTFGSVADLITGKPPPPPASDVGWMQVGVGMQFHNDVLLRCINDVEKLRLLVTSGEKLIKDPAFWKSLFARRKEIAIEILMLDPDSAVVKSRALSSYQDKPINFLETEIRENIETIRRMTRHCRKRQIPVTIRCSVYGEPPSFRMTFLGENRLLLTSYSEGSRTDDESIFYDLSGSSEGAALLSGCRREYTRIAGSAQPINQ